MFRPVLVLVAAAALAACSQEAPATEGAPDAAAPAETSAAEVTPASVRAMIEADGAQPTVAALWNENEGAAWDAVAAGVESGEQAWLDLVPLIEPGTENATAMDLSFALSRALLTQPAGVLALANGSDYCGNPEVEYMEDAARAAASNAAYYPAAIAAVEGVTDPALAGERQECLTALRAGQTAAG